MAYPILLNEAKRLDSKEIDLYAVYVALIYDATELFHTLFTVPVITGKIRRINQLRKACVYPKSVCTVVCQTAEVIFGIVINLVEQLISPLWGTVGRREISSGDATPDT